MTLKSICVFCGASPGSLPVFREAALAVGAELARRGVRLVYGGGDVGLMGAVADGALAGGGTVIGVIPEALAAQEIAHPGVSDLRVVRSMHERKALMAELSDGFVALPGGYGTFEEFCEVVTWTQLGVHSKSCGLLNVAGFYDPLLALIDGAVEKRFIRAEHRALVLSDTDFPALLAKMATFVAPTTPKWIDRDAT